MHVPAGHDSRLLEPSKIGSIPRLPLLKFVLRVLTRHMAADEAIRDLSA